MRSSATFSAVSTAAFTLLELLLVLTLIGVLASIGAARLSGLRRGQNLDGAARQVLEQALRTQHLAQARSEPVRLRLDPTALTASVQIGVVPLANPGTDPPDGHTATVDLGSGAEALTLVFNRDDGTAVSSGIIDLIYLPDAHCDTPGSIVLTSAGRSVSVTIPAGRQPPAMVASTSPGAAP